MAINKEYCKRVMAETLMTYTSLQEDQVMEMVDQAPLSFFQKGDILQHQGEEPSVATYFVVKGCIRQFASDENGKEITVKFYSEQEPINIMTFLDDQGQSYYSLACLEECVLAYCSDLEDDGSDDPPEIQALENLFFKKQFNELQLGLSDFKLKSPEERFQALVESQPQLFNRVPQKYLASYLGITPESFSRFKKRQGI